MALAPGTRLGPYEVTALIGAGGMGEVYRATDTNLKRQVAIKALPASVASDPDRVARFQREAEVLAALNHPNIAHIHGLERSDGTFALVLELVEGPTLADQIAKGAIPFDEALTIAKQIVDAFEAAHEQGIIHRDLKPANVKVREDGTVKVLDFGLAKAMEPSSARRPDLTNSPTITTPAMMTGVGMILGTAAYMSPEQAKGRPADKRSDIWAFGCVLYEMLTGTRVFEGEDVSDTLASVLKGEPNWAAIPSSVPSRIQQLLRRCLQKDSRRRLQAIGEARIVVEEVLAGEPDDISPAQSGGARSTDVIPGWRRAIPVALGAVVTAALAGVLWWRFWPPATPVGLARFSIPVAQSESLQGFTNTGRQVLALSPDGTQIVYSANQRLYLRTMADLDASAIPGIDGSYSVVNPVFSPDGRSIAFWSGGDETLKQIGVAGGSPVTIATVTVPVGMSWNSDGILLGQLATGVVRVPLNGGAPKTVVSVKSDEIAHGPQMLPGGKAVMFTLAKRGPPDRWDHAKIVVQSLTSGERKVLIDGGSDARYVPTGHLVYAVGGVVLAVPFDVRRLEVSGAPVPIVEGVMRAIGSATGTAQFSVAANGSLAYIPGPVTLSTADRALALIDRKGTVTPLTLTPGAIEHPRLSPDGRHVAFVIDDARSAVVWTYELSGASGMHRVTFSGRNYFPIWDDKGKGLAFQSDRDGDRGIFWQPVDGTGAPQQLTKADKDTQHVPESWSPKGDGFLFRVVKGDVSTLWFFSLKDQKAIPFGTVQSVGPTNSTFSPDGRWVAYETRMTALGTGRGFNDAAIYVQPFPATGAIYQLPAVEPGGYRHPRWSPDGKELFFIIGGNVRVKVVSVKTQPDFVFGNAESLMRRPAYWLENAGDNATQWDVLPDGQHFIIETVAGSVGKPDTIRAGQQIQVVLNWFTELQQRVPTR